jgi:hypothetical protein
MNSDREELLNENSVRLEHHPECAYSRIASRSRDIVPRLQVTEPQTIVHCGCDYALQVHVT